MNTSIKDIINFIQINEKIIKAIKKYKDNTNIKTKDVLFKVIIDSNFNNIELMKLITEDFTVAKYSKLFYQSKKMKIDNINISETNSISEKDNVVKKLAYILFETNLPKEEKLSIISNFISIYNNIKIIDKLSLLVSTYLEYNKFDLVEAFSFLYYLRLDTILNSDNLINFNKQLDRLENTEKLSIISSKEYLGHVTTELEFIDIYQFVRQNFNTNEEAIKHFVLNEFYSKLIYLDNEFVLNTIFDTTSEFLNILFSQDKEYLRSILSERSFYNTAYGDAYIKEYFLSLKDTIKLSTVIEDIVTEVSGTKKETKILNDLIGSGYVTAKIYLTISKYDIKNITTLSEVGNILEPMSYYLSEKDDFKDKHSISIQELEVEFARFQPQYEEIFNIIVNTNIDIKSLFRLVPGHLLNSIVDNNRGYKVYGIAKYDRISRTNDIHFGNDLNLESFFLARIHEFILTKKTITQTHFLSSFIDTILNKNLQTASFEKLNEIVLEITRLKEEYIIINNFLTDEYLGDTIINQFSDSEAISFFIKAFPELNIKERTLTEDKMFHKLLNIPTINTDNFSYSENNYLYQQVISDLEKIKVLDFLDLTETNDLFVRFNSFVKNKIMTGGFDKYVPTPQFQRSYNKINYSFSEDEANKIMTNVYAIEFSFLANKFNIELTEMELIEMVSNIKDNINSFLYLIHSLNINSKLYQTLKDNTIYKEETKNWKLVRDLINKKENILAPQIPLKDNIISHTDISSSKEELLNILNDLFQ